jgi:hypothetical protein
MGYFLYFKRCRIGRNIDMEDLGMNLVNDETYAFPLHPDYDLAEIASKKAKKHKHHRELLARFHAIQLRNAMHDAARIKDNEPRRRAILE